MNALLNFRRNAQSGVAQHVTGEDLVRIAERIGRIHIERGYSNKVYKAQIRFENRNGSDIWATGEDTDFFGALAKAIEEAERLK